MWTIQVHDGVEKRFKRFEKKWPHELANLNANLDQLFVSLQAGIRPEQLKRELRFVRSEPKGVLAIDQKGPGKGAKLVAIRLYVYPDEETSILHLIGLGDKSSQPDDIECASAFVVNLLLTKDHLSRGPHSPQDPAPADHESRSGE